MERGVIITLDNGALGGSQNTQDGIFGLILYGDPYTEEDITANFPAAIYSVEDAEALGISEQRDAITQSDMHFQIASFYAFAENVGRKLWISVIGNNTTMADVFSDSPSEATTLLDAAQGEISMLFLGGKRDASHDNALTYFGGLSSQVMPALITANRLASIYAAKIKPLRVIIDGYALNSFNLLQDLTQMSYNRVGVFLATHNAGYGSAIGLLAGRLAFTPVNESAGWVEKGNLPVSAGFLTNREQIENIQYLNGIIDKGYITFVNYATKFGYFLSNPTMATNFADDYRTVTNARAIDKAFKLAYNTFVKYVNGKLYITKKGTINILQVKQMEADIENVINTQMVAKGECSFVKCIIDPNQKVLSTNEFRIGIKIIPTATLELLKVKLGFAQSI